MTEKELGDNAPDKKGNLHRINLSSLRPQWRLYSFSLVDIFVTGSALTSYFIGVHFYPFPTTQFGTFTLTYTV